MLERLYPTFLVFFLTAQKTKTNHKTKHHNWYDVKLWGHTGFHVSEEVNIWGAKSGEFGGCCTGSKLQSCMAVIHIHNHCMMVPVGASCTTHRPKCVTGYNHWARMISADLCQAQNISVDPSNHSTVIQRFSVLENMKSAEFSMFVFRPNTLNINASTNTDDFCPDILYDTQTLFKTFKKFFQILYKICISLQCLQWYLDYSVCCDLCQGCL